MATIQQFYTVAQKQDFARVFQFRLRQFGNLLFSSSHLAYVETASLPGRQITNIPVTFMGMDFNTPGTVKYPGSAGYQVTFRCDQNYDIRAALEAATFSTFDESTSEGTYGVPGTQSRLILELFDKQFLPIRTYTLFGVWVQSLGDTAFDVKDTGQVQTIQATLAYQFWRVAGPGQGQATPTTPITEFGEGLSVQPRANPAGGDYSVVVPNRTNWPTIL